MVTKEEKLRYYQDLCRYTKGSAKKKLRRFHFMHPKLPYFIVGGELSLPPELKLVNRETQEYVIAEWNIQDDNNQRMPDEKLRLRILMGLEGAETEADVIKYRRTLKGSQTASMKDLHNRQRDTLVTFDLLAVRADRAIRGGYTKQKWIWFCENILGMGLNAYLYEAKETKSKYITIHKEGFMPYKVRFSDHISGDTDDCNFVVGKYRKPGSYHDSYITADMALKDVVKYFGVYRLINDAYGGGVDVSQ